MPPGESIEARVQRLEDEAAIRALVPVYCLSIDDRDWERLEALFAEDAAFDDGATRHEGRPSVLRYYREALSQRGPTYHYAHSHLVEFDDLGHARGVVSAHAELWLAGETYLVALRYIDRYGRQSGRWCFTERRLRMLYAMRLADLPSGLGDRERLRWPGIRPRAAHWPAFALWSGDSEMKYWIQVHQIGRFAHPRDLVELAVRAEALGFEALALPDHIIFPASLERDLERSWYEQLTVAAYLAARTSTLRFCTAATVATQRNPILLAKQAATLDFLSGGRFGLALAPGWLEQEIEWLGCSSRSRGARLEETIELIRALLTTDPVNFTSANFSIKDASFHPKPVQRPLPIHVGGTAARSARRAARLGDGWQPSGSFEEFRESLPAFKREMESLGRDLKSFPIALELPIYDFPDNVLRHYRETGTSAPETFGGDFDRALARIEESAREGVTHSVLFPAKFTSGEIQTALEAFSRQVIQVS